MALIIADIFIFLKIVLASQLTHDGRAAPHDCIHDHDACAARFLCTIPGLPYLQIVHACTTWYSTP